MSLIDPATVLATGEHAGHAWIVAHSSRQFRCGYVRLPAGHPWHGRSDEEIGAAVHGGLTFSEPEPAGNGWWIGFDCGHADDAIDPVLPRRQPPVGTHSGPVWTQAETEAECRRLCEQAATRALW